MKITKFNVRVYGLLINDSQEVLLIHERFAGKWLNKFPGGGVELGEGIAKALKRELQEELSLSKCTIEHFYTHDEFLQSAFKPEEQIIAVYYLVKDFDLAEIHFNIEESMGGEGAHLKWFPVSEDLIHQVELPADLKAVQKLLKGL